VVEEGDNVYAQSSGLEKQSKEAEDSGTEVSPVMSIEDNAEALDNVERETPSTLTGNAMSEYVMDPLIKDGELIHKKGKEPKDHMNSFYAWMNAAGIKLQNIIDDELSNILKVNPHAKVKFMAVRPEHNATNDAALSTDLMLVLDFDDNVNKGITSMHKKENGGIIESNGKKYLIIGVAGYGSTRNKDKQNLYNILFGANPNSSNGYGLIKRGMKPFFDTHPEERFYVDDNISTEVVSISLIPGYRVRKLETDEGSKFRKLSELLNDKQRNPHGLTLQNLMFGVQTNKEFVLLNMKSNVQIMPPKNINKNRGSAFILIPASNGKYMPAYVKPLFYREMQDSTLKRKINELLNQVVAPNYNDRLNAVVALSRIFYLNKDENTFLLRKKSNIVSIVKDGVVIKTFNLDSSFNRQEFMDAVETMNPRINLYIGNLSNQEELKKYDEAGALMTDLAKLGTAGSSYSIYAVDAEGKMIQPVSNSNTQATKAESNSDLRNTKRLQIVYNGRYYREANGTFYLNGKPVKDEDVRKQLEYNKRIIEGELVPFASKGIEDYYIVSTTDDNPVIIKVNRNTKEVEELSKEESIKYIQKEEERKEQKRRREEAEKALEAQDPKKATMAKAEDVALGFDFEESLGISQEEETLETEPFSTPIETIDKSIDTSTEEKDTKIIKKEKQGETTVDFNTLMQNIKWLIPILHVVQKKWVDAPKNRDKLMEFLRNKDVEVDNILNTEEGIKAWLQTLEECR